MPIFAPFATIAAVALAQSSLSEPPLVRAVDPYARCTCSAEAQSDVIEIDGIVRDAELRVGPDGRSVLPEQTTVFSVIAASDADVGEMVRVRHDTRPSKCGLSFDYGKRYRIRVVGTDGGFRSDYCLDPRRSEAAGSTPE